MTVWLRWVVLEDLILHSKYTIVYIVYLLYLHSRFLYLLRLGLCVCVCNFDGVDGRMVICGSHPQDTPQWPTARTLIVCQLYCIPWSLLDSRLCIPSQNASSGPCSFTAHSVLSSSSWHIILGSSCC